MPVLYEKRGSIGIITLSRPKNRNAWAPDFYESIDDYFNEMEADDEIRCVILTGDEDGGAFCAGANLKDPNTHSHPSTADFISPASGGTVPRRPSIPAWQQPCLSHGECSR